jgi:ribosomal protein L9
MEKEQEENKRMKVEEEWKIINIEKQKLEKKMDELGNSYRSMKKKFIFHQVLANLSIWLNKSENLGLSLGVTF